MKQTKRNVKTSMLRCLMMLSFLSILVTVSLDAAAKVTALSKVLIMAPINVTGKVTDSRNAPIEGVSVAVDYQATGKDNYLAHTGMVRVAKSF